MITSYFKLETPIVKRYEYFELYNGFFAPNNFKKLNNEIKNNFVKNSGRMSCVCVSEEFLDKFNIYNLPKLNWTPLVSEIRDKILGKYIKNEIDYGLIHYYQDEKATINWHSDREALRSYIFSISLGGTRRFSLRDKTTNKVFDFDLNDGDLFIMKPGCQDRFEHCIKSIKKYNQPRISITFRKIESLFKNYIFDSRNYLITLENPDSNKLEEISSLKQGIIVYLVTNEQGKIFEVDRSKSNKNASLLKSNLQKAIRRKNKQIALDTTLKMITENMAIELLRRLTIITFEDVVVNKYFPIIVWLYIAISSKDKYKLTYKDVEFIYSYVGLLCDIEYCYKPKEGIILPLNEFKDDVICLSLYLRIQYGGFKSEINLMNNLIYEIYNKKTSIDTTEMQIINIPRKIKKNIDILDSAIDFHCFHRMPLKVLARVDKKFNFTEKDIKQYIWDFDSKINLRDFKEEDKERLDIWTKVIKPKCDSYRSFIKNMIEL